VKINDIQFYKPFKHVSFPENAKRKDDAYLSRQESDTFKRKKKKKITVS